MSNTSDKSTDRPTTGATGFVPSFSPPPVKNALLEGGGKVKRKKRGNPQNLLGPRTDRHGLALAKLAEGLAGPYRAGVAFRRELERLVKERFGEVSLIHLARIQSCVRCEVSCRVLESKTRADMEPKELRSMRNSVLTWTRMRDNLLEELLGDGPRQAPSETGRANRRARKKAKPSIFDALDELPDDDGTQDEENAVEGDR